MTQCYSLHTQQKRARMKALAEETAAQAIGPLSPGMRLIGLTKGQFSMIDIIRAVVEQTGPADLSLVAWSTGVEDAKTLNWFTGTSLIRSLRLITDRSLPGCQPDVASILANLPPESIRTTRVHAKFCTIRTAEWSIAIRCSMNLNKNIRCELFDLDDDPEIADFLDAWVVEVFGSHPPGLVGENAAIWGPFKRLMVNTSDPAAATDDDDLRDLLADL